MAERVKKLGRRSIWLFIAAVLIALVVIFAYPQVKALHLQSKAGRLIADYVTQLKRDEPDSVDGVFYCLLPILYPELPKSNDMDKAIMWLNEAKSLAPNNTHSRLLLGQTYCLKQDFQQAIDVLDDFLTFRSDNQLAQAEIGYAYLALSRTTLEPQKAQTFFLISTQLLAEIGYSASSILNLGDAAFDQERYQDALTWHEISDPYSRLQDQGLFRHALLRYILKGSFSNEDQIQEGMILELDSDLIIEPTDLFILSTGFPIKTKNENGQPVGMLYSNSQDAGILFRVNEGNIYCIFGRALDKQPAPTQIGVDIDFETEKVVDLVNGNGDWLDFGFGLVLDEGVHLLSVKLMNDAIVNGIDRNAYIGAFNVNLCERK